MLTIKAEIKKSEQKVDGTFNVKLRFTLDRKVKRISTSLFVSPTDLTRTGDFKKSSLVKEQIDNLVNEYKIKCAKLQIDLHHYTLEQIFQLLKYNSKETSEIEFISFCKNWISKATIKGASNYTTALNAFVKYAQKDTLPVNSISKEFVFGFKEFLYKERENRVKKLTEEGKRIPSNRSVSLYLIALKRLYKELQTEYNNYDLNIVPFPTSPFDGLKIPKQEVTRKRAISPENIVKISKLPNMNIGKGIHHTCRRDLAKDCFMLSFYLMGMNSVDLYNATEYDGEYITYYRTKTKDRRSDKAKMIVRVPEIAKPIIEKYRNRTKNPQIFNFYRNYADEKAFNKAINKGLKEIGVKLNIEDLEFYAARHSWATIALNKCKIDKYTIHSALNHVDPSMRVTDIYIERDFVNENEANMKVLKFVFG